MSFHSWLQNLRTTLVPGRGQRRRRQRGSPRVATYRPNVEVLEDRLTPSFSFAGGFPYAWDGTVDVSSDPNLDAFAINVAVAVTLDTADFNGDNQLDFLTISSSFDLGGWVNVYLGRGDGSFVKSPEDYGAGWQPINIGTGGFNNDTHPDFLVLTWDYDYGAIWAVVYLNNGDWGYSPPPPPPPGPPSISIDDSTVTEGNTGTVSASFIVALSAASTETITVAYATGNETATAGSDYQAASGTFTFAPGEISKTVTVPVKGDRLTEPNETFVVNLSSPTNATIVDGEGVGTIMDDEPRISISDVTKSEGRKGRTTQFTFTVTLSAAYDQAVTMSFRTADGTATTGDGDYVGKTGTITFAPGETTKTITIEVKGDSKEANETFYLDLFGNSSNSLFTENRGIGTILNDD